MNLDELSQQLINRYQQGFPLTGRPFLQLAEEFGVSEQDVIDRMQTLKDNDVLSRLGPVFDHKKAGASTLAALAVPPEQLDSVAEQVNQFAEINHNYAREHRYNLWFVATAADDEALESALENIQKVTGFVPLVLPMVKSYHIDLSFGVDFTGQQS